MHRKKKVGSLEQILALTRRNQPRAPFFSSKVEVEAGKLGSTQKSEIRPKEVDLAQAGKAERKDDRFASNRIGWVLSRWVCFAKAFFGSQYLRSIVAGSTKDKALSTSESNLSFHKDTPDPGGTSL